MADVYVKKNTFIAFVRWMKSMENVNVYEKERIKEREREIDKIIVYIETNRLLCVDISKYIYIYISI